MSQTIPFDSVADLYDSYVCVDFDIPFWLNELGQREGRVLEVTSGTGRVSLLPCVLPKHDRTGAAGGFCHYGAVWELSKRNFIL